MLDAGRQTPYLVVSEPELESAQQFVGARYNCVTRYQAMNGSGAAMRGHTVVCWPPEDKLGFTDMRVFAGQSADSLAHIEVKFLDVDDHWQPSDFLKRGTTFEQFVKLCKETGRIEVIQPTKPIEVIEAAGSQPDELEKNDGISERSIAPMTRAGLGSGQNTRGKSRTPINEGSAESVPVSTSKEQSEDSVTPPSEPLEPSPMPDSLPIDAYADEPTARWQPVLVESKPSHWQRPDNRPSEPLEWPAPTDFWADPTPPEMRPEWMPPALADYFSHEAETWGADPGIFWGFGVGICAGAMSDAIKINVKPSAPSYVQSARLHIGIAGDPGDMKSPILTSLVRPFGQLEDRLMEEAAKAIEKYADDHEAYEILRKKYVAAKVDGKSTDRPIAPERPCRNRLMVKGSTIEGLRTVLQDQGDRGILEVHDELISIFTGANQYKKGGDDLQKRLQLWDGGPTTFDLAGQHVRIKNWSTSIIGGTQPAKLRRTIAKMGLAEDGTLQRFNIYLTRHATLDLERPEHPGNAEFADIVERLYWMQHQGAVKYSPEADIIRRDFRIWTHEQGQRPWMDGSLKQHLAKHTNFFARFCLTYHAIESAAQHSAYIQPIIQPETAQRVADLFQQCLYPHAEAFYGQIMDGSNEFIKEVRYLAEKLLAKNPREIDLTWITHGWTKWRTFKPWEKKNILTVLTDAGWLRSKDPRGFIDGAPYRASVNPALQTLFAEYVGPIRGRLEEMEERRQRKMGD